MPESVLEPWSSWPSREEYDKRYKDLALRFKQNFKKFESQTPRKSLTLALTSEPKNLAALLFMQSADVNQIV